MKRLPKAPFKKVWTPLKELVKILEKQQLDSVLENSTYAVISQLMEFNSAIKAGRRGREHKVREALAHARQSVGVMLDQAKLYEFLVEKASKELVLGLKALGRRSQRKTM